jgi:hypothetical protein
VWFLTARKGMPSSNLLSSEAIAGSILKMQEPVPLGDISQVLSWAKWEVVPGVFSACSS